MPVLPTRHISIAIDRPIEEVYGFLADPMNFPTWAEGLGGEFHHVEGTTYHAQTPMGPMRVMFSEPNRYGVLDHVVIPTTARRCTTQCVRWRMAAAARWCSRCSGGRR